MTWICYNSYWLKVVTKGWTMRVRLPEREVIILSCHMQSASTAHPVFCTFGT
jgi:hypothetical protein